MSSLADDPEAIAKALGLACVYPEPNQLFIDLDDPADRVALAVGIEALKANGIIATIEKETTSKGGNAHVYVRLHHPHGGAYPVENDDRVLLQACLGSDRKRELLSLFRLWGLNDSGKRAPTVFFEKVLP